MEFNSKDWKDMIYVRDYLRNNENAKKRYGNFKKKLIEQRIETIQNYSINKREIFKQILDEAWGYMKNR